VVGVDVSGTISEPEFREMAECIAKDMQEVPLFEHWHVSFYAIEGTVGIQTAAVDTLHFPVLASRRYPAKRNAERASRNERARIRMGALEQIHLGLVGQDREADTCIAELLYYAAAEAEAAGAWQLILATDLYQDCRRTGAKATTKSELDRFINEWTPEKKVDPAHQPLRITVHVPAAPKGTDKNSPDPPTDAELERGWRTILERWGVEPGRIQFKRGC
jgi:hypothetical protein